MFFLLHFRTVGFLIKFKSKESAEKVLFAVPNKCENEERFCDAEKEKSSLELRIEKNWKVSNGKIMLSRSYCYANDKKETFPMTWFGIMSIISIRRKRKQMKIHVSLGVLNFFFSFNFNSLKSVPSRAESKICTPKWLPQRIPDEQLNWFHFAVD